jgi:hypothetical protein
MVRWTRSARIVPGKFSQAIKWAKEITEFINKKYKLQQSVYMDLFGEYGTIRWFVDYADLAALEKMGNQILADQEYRQKVNQATELLIQDSVFDTVMHSM